MLNASLNYRYYFAMLAGSCGRKKKMIYSSCSFIAILMTLIPLMRSIYDGSQYFPCPLSSIYLLLCLFLLRIWIIIRSMLINCFFLCWIIIVLMVNNCDFSIIKNHSNFSMNISHNWNFEFDNKDPKNLMFRRIIFSTRSTLARACSKKVQRAQQTPPRMQHMHTRFIRRSPHNTSTNQRSLNAIQPININPDESKSGDGSFASALRCIGAQKRIDIEMHSAQAAAVLRLLSSGSPLAF